MKETMMDILFTYGLPALGAAFMALMTWVSSVVVKYLTDKTKSRKIIEALEKAEKAILTAVGDVMQTYVNSLKEAGEWTAETEELARQEAFLKAQKAMGPLVWSLLNEYFMQDGQSTAKEWCMLLINSYVEPIKKVRADRKLAEAQLAQLKAQADALCEPEA